VNYHSEEPCKGIDDISLEKSFITSSALPCGVLSNYSEKGVRRIRACSRVGPHNRDVLSVFYGTLLGDSHAEKRIQGKGTRLSFYQEALHSEYLLWLHQYLSSLGYCNPKTPKIQTRLGAKGRLRYGIRFHTYTYSSLNALHEV
jgi:hypothetical protein